MKIIAEQNKFPAEIFNKYIIIESINLKKKSIDNFKINITNKKINKNRKEYCYQLNEKVFIKNMINKKLLHKYYSPFTISKIFDNENIIQIDKLNGKFIVNIKNIKPL
ncbi:hypothetical protein DMUE_0778 [Dictyocoela muelleri]|nr:hypothetical protein DMUE_0778 [Dictyocoela muelleri]